jgi:hypothetical protein
MRSFIPLNFALLLLPVLSGGVIVEDFHSLPATEYDFVIVGGMPNSKPMSNVLIELAARWHSGMCHGEQAVRESFAQDFAHRSGL